MSDLAVPAGRLMPVTLIGVRILFRNFAGAPTRFNPQGGKRDFAVVLPPDTAAAMEADGWNVKYLPAREQGDIDTPYIKVEVKYTDKSRPDVIFVTSRGRSTLPEEFVMMVDTADIDNVDLIVRPYQWEVNGNSGVKAYLKKAFITLREDELDLKYADVPEIQGNAGIHLDVDPDEIEGEIIEPLAIGR